jgi:hypothetical protein
MTGKHREEWIRTPSNVSCLIILQVGYLTLKCRTFNTFWKPIWHTERLARLLFDSEFTKQTVLGELRGFGSGNASPGKRLLFEKRSQSNKQVTG